MESKWRSKICDLELKGTEWIMAASYLVFQNGFQYHMRDVNGHNWRVIVNVSPAGAINVTKQLATDLPWTILAQFGIIEPD